MKIEFTKSEIEYAKKVLFINAIDFGVFSGNFEEFIEGMAKAIENGECLKEELFD